jgi:formamidopyrimidine-DNA glycosylase
MPELPEVETIRRGLERHIVGKTVDSFSVLVQRCYQGPGGAEPLLGAAICAVGRRGKLLVIRTDSGFSLLVHLRMTGQLIFRAAAGQDGPDDSCADSPGADGGEPTDGTTVSGGAAAADSAADDDDEQDFGGGYPNHSLIGVLPDKTTRIIIGFDDGSQLFFNDQRKFGYMKMVETALIEHDSFIASLGSEPLADDFGSADFKAALPLRSSRAIKAVLLDQHVVAGVGNIYADESLFLAGIMPDRPVSSLSDAEISRLYQAVRDCLFQSIADGGSTARDYRDVEGLRGEYLDLHAMVYNRAGQPCSICGSPIAKIRVAGRGTHFCGNCQR